MDQAVARPSGHAKATPPASAFSPKPGPLSAGGSPCDGEEVTPTAADVAALIDEAARAVAFGEQHRAATYARRVMRLIRACPDPKARQLVVDAVELLEPLLLGLVGGESRKVTLIQTPSAADSFLTPEQFYVASQTEGSVTVEELLDLSPLHHTETLDLVLELQAHRIVRLD